MAKSSADFVAYGFVKDGVDKKEPVVTVAGRSFAIKGKTPEEKLKFIKEKREELTKKELDKAFDKALQDIADHEWTEVSRDQLVMSDYPKAIRRYYMGMQTWHQSIEPYYYWCMNFLGDLGFPVVHKISDIFTAAEHSSFYGAGAQRLGLAQDKVGQYLATIGKMVKDLFQLVRELRWIDERLEIYRGALGRDVHGKKVAEPQRGAEQALKGLWVDLVDGVVGGQRTGSNLFVMAQQLQFTALPDLFFQIHPRNQEEVDQVVEDQAKEFNKSLRNLLKRKLSQYVAWKNSTYQEMTTRRKFTLDYLRQHYHVIRMYINWIKPYVKHIERLSGQQDLLNNPRLIAAFESSLIDIEVLGLHRPEGVKNQYTCLLLTFEYHTQPSMQYQGDGGYHRGPIHVGSTRITWRGYAWDDDTVKRYLAMREKQDMDLLTSIDESLRSAMDALGDDLHNYLHEAEFGIKEEEEEKPERQPLGLAEPFVAIGKGFSEVFKSAVPEWSMLKKKVVASKEKPAISKTKLFTYLHYHIFKKAHGLLSW